jgi:hypothetical protein
MKKVIVGLAVICIVVGTASCGTSDTGSVSKSAAKAKAAKKKAGQSAEESESRQDSANLDENQTKSLVKVIGQSAGQVYSNSKMMSPGNNYSLAPQTIDINDTMDCPAGGTIAFLLKGTVDTTNDLPKSVSVKISGLEGSYTLTACKFEDDAGNITTADGKVELKDGNGSFDAVQQAAKTDTYDVKGTGHDKVVGNIKTQSPSGNSDCDIDLDRNVDFAGTISTKGDVAITGKATVKGKACGKDVDESVDIKI